MRHFIRISVVFLSVLLLSGCISWVEDTDDLRDFVAATQSQQAPSIAPLPEFKPYRSFVYEAANMREPFLPMLESPLGGASMNGDGEAVEPDESREKEYLETFAIDQLAMVGTITSRDDSSLWALVRDENYEIHRVALGDYMGLDFGKVVALDERQIELKEIVTNGRGGWMTRLNSIVLSEQE